MSYGVLQEYLSSHWTFDGEQESTGTIGTTLNGVVYLSMPIFFALFTRLWPNRRQIAAMTGASLTVLSFFVSSYSTNVWHLIATQGVLSGLGCALVYSPMTLSLGEWYGHENRAVAYGVTLSCKNVVGSACPFVFRVLLDRYGIRVTLKIWTAIVALTSIPAILLIATPPMHRNQNTHGSPRIPWRFLYHGTFYTYCLAVILQSAGYGIPQTYLSTYAHEVAALSQTSATLLLTIFNLPGIISSFSVGYLSDKKRFSLSAAATTSISSFATALAVFSLWGLSSQGSFALLILFSITFGFFASGYSATWGGILNELEHEAAQSNEAIDAGMVYGLLNGARGVGYVSGGLASVPLLKAGITSSMSGFGYGTMYGPSIVFTGSSSILGGCGLLLQSRKLLKYF